MALWGREEVRTGLWWVNVRERAQLGDRGLDGKPLKWIFNIQDGGVDCITWLRTDISSGVL